MGLRRGGGIIVSQHKENREIIAQGLRDAIDQLKLQEPVGPITNIASLLWAGLATQCEVKLRKTSRRYGVEIVFKPNVWQQKVCTDSEAVQQMKACDYELIMKRAIIELIEHFYIVYKSFGMVFMEDDDVVDLLSKTKIRKRAIHLNIGTEVDYG